jgi:hypothetical protein
MPPVTKQSRVQTSNRRTRQEDLEKIEDQGTKEKKIVLVDKTGVLKDISIKEIPKNAKKGEDRYVNELYKKAGLKTADGFEEQFVWELEYEETKYNGYDLNIPVCFHKRNHDWSSSSLKIKIKNSL